MEHIVNAKMASTLIKEIRFVKLVKIKIVKNVILMAYASFATITLSWIYRMASKKYRKRIILKIRMWFANVLLILVFTSMVLKIAIVVQIIVKTALMEPRAINVPRAAFSEQQSVYLAHSQEISSEATNASNVLRIASNVNRKQVSA